MISNLESILEKGYQKHVLVFSINHVLGVLNEANALDQAAVEAVTDKVLSNVSDDNVETFSLDYNLFSMNRCKWSCSLTLPRRRKWQPS